MNFFYWKFLIPFLLQNMQSLPVSDRDQIEIYISSSIKSAFARVSIMVDDGYFSKVIYVVKLFEFLACSISALKILDIRVLSAT